MQTIIMLKIKYVHCAPPLLDPGCWVCVIWIAGSSAISCYQEEVLMRVIVATRDLSYTET